MECKKCNGTNVVVQTVGNVSSKGGTTPWWYWLCCVWMIDFVLYCCLIGFLGINIHKSFKKTKTKVQAYAVCQDCGHKWKI